MASSTGVNTIPRGVFVKIMLSAPMLEQLAESKLHSFTHARSACFALTMRRTQMSAQADAASGDWLYQQAAMQSVESAEPAKVVNSIL